MSAVWNYTLDDTSPVFKFEPYSDGDLTGGWQTWYSGSGFNTKFGEASSGDSFHLSSLSGASLSLSFFGTGIDLIGTANYSYQVTVDGSLQPNGSPPFNTLFSESDLESGIHSLTMTVSEVPEGGMLKFDKAILFSFASGQRNTPLIEKIDNQNTSVINYTKGSWQSQNDPQIPSRQSPSTYQQTKILDASAWLNFTGRAIEIRGESNWGWWTYEVTIDGQPYTGFNASSSWIVPDAVLFYLDGLNETMTHTLNITNTASEMNLALNTFSAFHFQSTAVDQNGTRPNTVDPGSVKHRGVPKGIIAGAILATLVGTMFLLGILYFFFVHRRKSMISGLTPHHNELLRPYSNDIMREHRGAEPSDNILVSSSFVPGDTSRNSEMESNNYISPPNLDTPSETLSRPSQTSTSPLDAAELNGPRSYAKDRYHLASRSLRRSRGVNGSAGGFPKAENDSAVDRIADVVAERIAQRLGRLPEQDVFHPPPDYEDHMY